MKKTLRTLTLSLTLAIGLALIQPGPAKAIIGIGDTCANCSTEFGDIARQIETMAQWANQYAQMKHQLEMMEQSIAQLPEMLKNFPIDGLKELAQLTNEAQTLKADQNAAIQIINELYPDQTTFARLAGASDKEIEAANAEYQQHYDNWSQKVEQGVLATFQVSSRQLKQIAESGDLDAYVENLVKTPNGQEQALEAANTLAAQQLKDSMEMRELMAAMAQGQSYQVSKQEKKDEMSQEQWKKVTDTSRYKQSGDNREELVPIH
jgi:P-type conjugative transfer protein TrbJ